MTKYINSDSECIAWILDQASRGVTRRHLLDHAPAHLGLSRVEIGKCIAGAVARGMRADPGKRSLGGGTWYLYESGAAA